MDFSDESSTVLPSNGGQGAGIVAIYHSIFHLIYVKKDNISLSCVLFSGSLVVIISGAWNLSANDKTGQYESATPRSV
jgi:hypothetical protein